MSSLTRNVRPLVSVSKEEARIRVLGLYRAWYRYIPYLLKWQDIPKNECDCRWKLREYFYKNSHLTDIRVIDLLVLKGYMELKEVTHQWQQKCHLMAHWNPTAEPKPHEFLDKFYSGID